MDGPMSADLPTLMTDSCVQSGPSHAGQAFCNGTAFMNAQAEALVERSIGESWVIMTYMSCY